MRQLQRRREQGDNDNESGDRDTYPTQLALASLARGNQGCETLSTYVLMQGRRPQRRPRGDIDTTATTTVMRQRRPRSDKDDHDDDDDRLATMAAVSVRVGT